MRRLVSFTGRQILNNPERQYMMNQETQSVVQGTGNETQQSIILYITPSKLLLSVFGQYGEEKYYELTDKQLNSYYHSCLLAH